MTVAAFLPALLLSPPADGADPTKPLAGSWGELAISLRYRLERVSDDAPAVAAEAGVASTFRTAILYTTPTWGRFSLYAELEDVSDLGAEHSHNNKGAGGRWNHVADRPAIADPDGTELNQAAVRFQGTGGTTLELGRLEVNLGDQRFVGAVGWRQNHQTLDAFRARGKAGKHLTWNYLFVDEVHRIFGDSQAMSSHLLDAVIDLGKGGKLSPYVYLLDYDDPAQFGLSTLTYGARWHGAADLGREWSLPYDTAVARQEDAGDNPAGKSVGYVHVEVGAARKSLAFRLGYELLEGSADEGQFITPLATLHKFNGWADLFLTTPANGLQDLYGSVSGKVGGVSIIGTFHDFSSDSLDIDYGRELDAQVLYTAPWKQGFGLKLALYDADQYAYDVGKVMAWTTYSF